MTAFAELVAASNYSFLHGASHPSDMVAQAVALGMSGIGIADRNTVAGVVRAYDALKKARVGLLGMNLPPIDFRLVVGARLVFTDGTPDIVAYPMTRFGWGRLTRLLTVGNRRAVKGGCILGLGDLERHAEDLILIALPDASGNPSVPAGDTILPPMRADAGLPATLAALTGFAVGRVWLGTTMPHLGSDARRLARLGRVAAEAGVPLLATCDALYADADNRQLHDIVTCIRTGSTIHKAGRILAANAERHLKSPDEMARLFSGHADAVAESQRILERIAFTLDDLRYEYPHEPVPEGWTAQDWLEHLAWQHAIERCDGYVPDKMIAQLHEEFALIRARNYAYYFLTVHDIVTCIRTGTTIHKAGRILAANAERHLKAPEEMARLFAAQPDTIAQSRQIIDRIAFTLDDLRYEYPHEPVPAGWEAQDWLEHLAWQHAIERCDGYVPDKMIAQLHEEFALIRARNYAYYFLTVHDIVRFARSVEPPILCQGRGSAANSVVCFVLGITSVDPMRHDLLFSRFVSAERDEPPDIDVDFEHERREEVMQYIYRRYGRHRAAIAATVIHYRPRSTVREIGKALGLTEDVTQRLTSTIWGSFSNRFEEKRFRETGFDPDNPEIVRLADLVNQLLEFPRHLSQHVGGYVLTHDRLDETVPIHNGAMKDRTFIEWDKDDIDVLGLMKVDILALGMLTCIRKAFDLMRDHGLGDHALETIANDEHPA
ncbi:MAG TPA: PHP domain-containing protein, partial [Sphingomonas sp.]|nr:PHP domain-containing protein [Sphingomonas sp.]